MFQHHCGLLYVPALTAWLVKKCQFGEVSNLLTWLRILSIFVAFSSSQTEASLNRGKVCSFGADFSCSNSCSVLSYQNGI
mgnify:CR=1 FL=1